MTSHIHNSKGQTRAMIQCQPSDQWKNAAGAGSVLGNGLLDDFFDSGQAFINARQA